MESKMKDNKTEEVNLNKRECWNGKKTASQLTIDFEATECFLGILKEKWESLNDSKSSKKQIWDVIANGLEEAGFCVRGDYKGQTCKTKWENLRKDYRSYISRFEVTGSGASDTKKKPKFFDSIQLILGSNNHSYRPPYVSDSLMNKQNPSKFQLTEKDESNVVEDDEQETYNKSKNKENKASHISDDEIFMDSLDENTSNDGIPERKKKRPSRASKAEKVLQVFQDMRQESIKRHSEEKSDRQKRHDEKMQQSQQMIDVMRTLISHSSKPKQKKKKQRDERSKRNLSPKSVMKNKKSSSNRDKNDSKKHLQSSSESNSSSDEEFNSASS